MLASRNRGDWGGSLQTLEVLHAEKGIIGLSSVISKGKIRTFDVPQRATSERQSLLGLRKNFPSQPVSGECV